MNKKNSLPIIIFVHVLIIIGFIEYFNTKTGFSKKNDQERVKIACEQTLSSTLEEIMNESKKLSEVGIDCYKNGGDACSKTNKSSAELMEFLDSEDLGLRWDHFSCSPILFSKIRYMRAKAEEIFILSGFKNKNSELERRSKELINPHSFIQSEFENIKKDCCQNRFKK